MYYSLGSGDTAPGTYTYTRISPTIGRVAFTETGVIPFTCTFTFTTSNSGSFTIAHSGVPVQTGLFGIGNGPAAPLSNISTRVALSAGQLLNPGFVVSGTVTRRVLVRAIGPTLSQFGVTSPMPAPQLAVFSGQTQIASNAGWGGSASMSAAFAATGAFPLATSSRDAAVVLTLSPGNYTAQISGDSGGEVLLEIYFVD